MLNMDDMNANARYEKDVSELKTGLAVIRSNYLTKADLAGFKVRIITWFIFMNVVLACIIVAAAKFIH